MKIWTKAAALLVLMLLVAFWQRANIVEQLLPQIMARAMQQDTGASLEDGLHVALCGAGGPLYDPKRSAPCVLIQAGDTLLMVDAGSGSARNIGRLGFNVGALELLLLTHFHSDHIDGLGELALTRWVRTANTRPLPVIGPEGVTEVVAGFNVAYEQDQRYRHEHHGDRVAPLAGAGMTATAFIAPPMGSPRDIFQRGDLRIEMFSVEHQPVEPAVGYRIYYKDRSMVISGDTRASVNVQEMAKGVDLLVHEALSSELVAMMGEAAQSAGNAVLHKIAADIPDYHTTPVEVAHIAAQARVGQLLFYHVVPALPAPGMDQLFMLGVEDVFPNAVLGKDGTLVSLPAGSEDIVTRELIY